MGRLSTTECTYLPTLPTCKHCQCNTICPFHHHVSVLHGHARITQLETSPPSSCIDFPSSPFPLPPPPVKVKCIFRPSALALAALSPCAAPTFTEPTERTQKFESETTSTTTAQHPHKQMCRQGSAGVVGPRDRQLDSPHFVHSPYSVHTYDARTDSRQRNDVHYSEMFKGDQGGNASQGQTEGSTERCAGGTTGHQVSFSPESSLIVHEYDDAYSPLVYGGRIRACTLETLPTHIINSTGDCHHRISAAEADEPERTIEIQREHETMQVCSDRTPEFHTEHAWRTVSRNPWVPQSQLGRGVE